MRALRADVLAAGIHNSDSKVNICTVITVSSLIRVNTCSRRTTEGTSNGQTTYAIFRRLLWQVESAVSRRNSGGSGPTRLGGICPQRLIGLIDQKGGA